MLANALQRDGGDLDRRIALLVPTVAQDASPEAATAREWAKLSWRLEEMPGTNQYKELVLLERVMGHLRSDFQNDGALLSDQLNLIDLGCGTGTKARRIIELAPSREIVYLPLDMNAAAGRIALAAVQHLNIEAADIFPSDVFNISESAFRNYTAQAALESFEERLRKMDQVGRRILRAIADPRHEALGESMLPFNSQEYNTLWLDAFKALDVFFFPQGPVDHQAYRDAHLRLSRIEASTRENYFGKRNLLKQFWEESLVRREQLKGLMARLKDNPRYAESREILEFFRYNEVVYEPSYHELCAHLDAFEEGLTQSDFPDAARRQQGIVDQYINFLGLNRDAIRTKTLSFTDVWPDKAPLEDARLWPFFTEGLVRGGNWYLEAPIVSRPPEGYKALRSPGFTARIAASFKEHDSMAPFKLVDEVRKNPDRYKTLYIPEQGCIWNFAQGNLTQPIQAIRYATSFLIEGKNVVLLLGQTLGNFDAPGRHEVLDGIGNALQQGDYFMVGVDLTPTKEWSTQAREKRIEAMQSEYQSGEAFARAWQNEWRRPYRATFNEQANRMEMSFGEDKPFAISHKFTLQEITELMSKHFEIVGREFYTGKYADDSAQPLNSGAEYVVVLGRKR